MRRLLLATTIGVGFAFTIISVWMSCRFSTVSTYEGFVGSTGLFSISYRHDQCVSIRRLQKPEWGSIVQLDVTTKMARTMGVFATVLGGLACLLTVTGSCLTSFFPISKHKWRRALAGSLLGASACQSLTFLLLVQVWDDENCGNGENECTLGFGAYCSIIACVCYFVAGVSVMILAFQPPKDNPGTTCLARLGLQVMDKLGISWKPNPLRNIRWQDIVLLLYTLSLAFLSCAVFFGCRFFIVSYRNNTRQYEEGLIRYYYYPTGVCKDFEGGPLQSFSPQSQAGRYFAGIAFVLAVLLTILLASMILIVQYPPVVYRALPGLVFLTALSQSFVFLTVTETYDVLCAEDIEDQSCELGQDAYIAIVNTILCLVAVPAFLWYSQNINNNTASAQGPERKSSTVMKNMGLEEHTSAEAGFTGNVSPPEIDTENANPHVLVRGRSVGSEEGSKME